jgi:hypothetical protein
MSVSTIILGASGTGKSASLRNLDPANTLMIQAIKKPLPFKSANWTHRSPANPTGNIFVADEKDSILYLMKNTKRKVIVIDDVQYIMANEFMRRSHELGFQKFTDIGKAMWEILGASSSLPDDVRVYLLWHNQTDDLGTSHAKTIGKLLDDKITVEGMVSIVLNTAVVNGNYFFDTHNSGSNTTKSPMGLFDEDSIPNDLALVDERICSYYNIEP